ncbi:MAG: VanZ family protein [Armatimonadota bacterium]
MRFAWAMSGTYAAIILVLTSLPANTIPLVSRFDIADFVIHACMYLPLAVLVLRAMLLTWPGLSFAAVGRNAWLSVVAFGLLDELHQLPLLTRSCSMWDWLADAAGALVGIGIAYLYVTYVRSKKDG